jgi:hypothetical protein
VAQRLQGEAIRCEHDMAELYGSGPDWAGIAIRYHKARELREQATSCMSAALISD